MTFMWPVLSSEESHSNPVTICSTLLLLILSAVSFQGLGLEKKRGDQDHEMPLLRSNEGNFDVRSQCDFATYKKPNPQTRAL